MKDRTISQTWGMAHKSRRGGGHADEYTEPKMFASSSKDQLLKGLPLTVINDTTIRWTCWMTFRPCCGGSIDRSVLQCGDACKYMDRNRKCLIYLVKPAAEATTDDSDKWHYDTMDMRDDVRTLSGWRVHSVECGGENDMWNRSLVVVQYITIYCNCVNR